MADELQALLDKINDEGLKKAQKTADDLIAQAEKEADAILADAKAQAAKVLADAQTEAAIQLKEGKQKLSQACRDVLLALRATLQTRVQKTVGDLMKETLDGNRLAAVISAVITEYVARNGRCDDLTVLVDNSQLAVIEAAVKAHLAADFRANPVLAPSKASMNGFKLVFNGNEVMYDFSDQALSETIAAAVGPKIAAALNA